MTGESAKQGLEESFYDSSAVTMRISLGFMQSLYKFANEVVGTQGKPKPDLLMNFSVRYKDIDQYRDKYESAYSCFASKCKDQSLRLRCDEEFARFHDMYYSVKVLYESVYPTIDKPSGCSNQTKLNQFHLPKISINHFTGVYTEWPNFKAMFDSLIHNCAELNNVQKMHYLFTLLQKEPANLIKHLELSDSNYNIAYKILCERYENKRLIADKHLEAILSLSSLNTNQLSSGLRKTVNALKENLQALSALGFDVSSWSFILLHIIVRKLPTDLRSNFELKHGTTDIPTFDNLISFLETHLKVLEAVSGSKGTSTNNAVQNSPKTSHTVTSVTSSSSVSPCVCCKGDHLIYSCDKFNSMTPHQRKDFAIANKLCFNCLRAHSVNKCTSKSYCQVCQGRHHTKLHLDYQPSTSSSSTDSASIAAASGNVAAHSSTNASCHSTQGGSTMMLGTALVGVQDINGHVHQVRALLDSGSEVTLMTESLAQKLRLPRSNYGPINGIGASSNNTNGKVSCIIQPLSFNNTHSPLVTSAIVLKKLTKNNIPCIAVSSCVLEKCKDMILADSRCTIPGPIDMLIGLDLYDEIYDGRRIKLGEGLPIAHASIFGWVLRGKAPAHSVSCHTVGTTALTCTTDLDTVLTRFWQVEEAPVKVIQDPEDVQCETHFVETHSRDSTGRFIVRLPFRNSHQPLGETHSNALKRFHNLERKLMKNEKLRTMYREFMADYQHVGHMRPVFGPLSKDRYYIPHHGVLKESSSTTKLRAVFDASSPSSSGVSLNNVLLPGPKLQQNVEDIILRFRTHAIVFTCDIKQMYRQVRMHDEDCVYQTIFWRESPDQPLQQFELTTVTYGVSSSAYLAMRVIQELASLNQSTKPEVARVLREDTFVDDIISGSHDAESAKALQSQVVETLAQGGFQLRKWASNCDELLGSYPSDHLEQPFRFEESGDQIFKVLGVEWNSQTDSFIFHVSNIGECSTKRQILSSIARIYDPCGYLTPITFYAKVIMQQLWLDDVSWDDALPEHISKLWRCFVEGFACLKLPSLPRFVLGQGDIRCNLMGFSDASEKGYSAVVYLRVQSSPTDVKVHLLLAKSRVSPIKQKLTIPRLELSGCVLLAKLLNHVSAVLGKCISIADTIAWCDSTIAIAWIKTPPHRLQTFESNRVSQINGLVPNVTWRYVPSALNPADCACRGLLPSDIVHHQLWWSPSWCRDDPSRWPANVTDTCENLPGLKPSASSCLTADAGSSGMIEPSESLLSRFSSLSRLKRTVAWCFRFIHNLRNQQSKRTGPLSVQELDGALGRIIKLVQDEAFSDVISHLNKQLRLKGAIARLNPFIDSDGFIRVGGRLQHSNLPFATKHPLLLPKRHHFVNILVDFYHQTYLHAGPSTLLNILHQKFWILSARSVVRHRVYLCHKCYRLKAQPLEPLMGSLPPHRIRQSRPNSKIGIDFAGPFNIKVSTIRNAKIRKAYLCIFVCLAVKAVHLEVTSDLTTNAFIACFDRFVARRGLPSDVYSDCGTNFQGAKRYLSEVEAFLNSKEDEIGDSLTKMGVNWHMNPPYSPHMGGLWESTVKSAKLLFKRTIGEQVLTFEELATVFAKIEAILNSRPLCPMSSDPHDLEALTPGHFLIGQPLICLPEYDYDQTPMSRLNRWQLIQAVTQHFWQRWRLEYLHHLQQRAKWHKSIDNLKVGDLVLLKNDQAPPLRWPKGRVLKLHPGADGVVRVIELRTKNGTCLRSVGKVCPLPVDNTGTN